MSHDQRPRQVRLIENAAPAAPAGAAAADPAAPAGNAPPVPRNASPLPGIALFLLACAAGGALVGSWLIR